MAIRKSSNSGIPFGNTAGRPTAATGQPYFNGETARLELYTSLGAWENIVQEVPGVSSISGQYLETNNSNTITIYGTNFVSGASAYAVGTNAVEVAATSTTFNSLVQLTAVFTGLIAANEPYDIKVVNPSNLFGILPDSLFVNNQVTWTTSAGSLGTFGDAVAMSVSATATDESTITYAVASGSSLPSGITLNTATGLISGTLPDVASNTTYTFTLTASDGSNPAVSRQFSFTSNAAPVWQTSSGSLGDFAEQSSISATVNATDSSDTVTYSLASGSTLPSGITLNSSTGVISGTSADVASSTTYTFTINANDGVNSVSREFSFIVRPAVTIEALVVAGGGAGGAGHGGGGGAGGFRSIASYTALAGSPITVTVGSGGSGAVYGSTAPTNGGPSQFGSISATGGGKAGAQNSPDVSANPDQKNGSSGGSGGGGGNTTAGAGAGGAGNAGAYTPVEGYAGANSNYGTASWASAGGGGAGGAGAGQASSGYGGNGGIGATSSITGTSVTYASGGGGCGGDNNGASYGTASAGGGTNGVQGNAGASQAAAANTGGGSGGARDGNSGNGGSGVVILKFLVTPASSTGSPVITTSGGYNIYKFNNTGSITF